MLPTVAGSDEALYAQWREGSSAAGDELVRLHGAAVLRFFANKVGPAAEDLLQQTFLGCMTTGVDPRELRSFRALLFGIARKQLLRHYEGRGTLAGEEMMSRVSLAELRTTATQKIAKEQDRALVESAMAQLPLDFQIALELRYWQRLTVGEIGDALGMTESGAGSRIRRARAQLKDAYAALADGGDIAALPEFR